MDLGVRKSWGSLYVEISRPQEGNFFMKGQMSWKLNPEDQPVELIPLQGFYAAKNRYAIQDGGYYQSKSVPNTGMIAGQQTPMPLLTHTHRSPAHRASPTPAACCSENTAKLTLCKPLCVCFVVLCPSFAGITIGVIGIASIVLYLYWKVRVQPEGGWKAFFKKGSSSSYQQGAGETELIPAGTTNSAAPQVSVQ